MRKGPPTAQGMSFRHSAGFGKRIEFWIIGLMLKQGMDVYVPLVDDHAVDAIIKRADGSIAQVQIKARSSECIPGDAALFSAISHDEPRTDYWFVFYSERMDALWLMTSDEFINASFQNKKGKNAAKRTIWFNGHKMDKVKNQKVEYCKPQFTRFLVADFQRIVQGA